MDHERRRRAVAARLPELDADALLITRLPNVRYLTGFSGSNGQLLLTGDGGVFLTDGRYAGQSRREVPDLRIEVYAGDFPAAFGTVAADLEVGRVGFESAGLTHQSFTQLCTAAPGVALIPTRQEVERLRALKDPEEVRLLDAAQEITDAAFEAILDRAVEGVTERRMAFELDTFVREQTADGLAFDTILGFGENAAEPHHHPTDRPLRRGDFIKMDFGCVVGGYHSDMTRTVAFGGPPRRLIEIYDVVRRAQQAGVDAARPGATCGQVDAAARDVIRAAGLGDAFPHGLGHGVGLEIHEAPSLRTGNDEPLAAGHVVTVEPGVYLDGVGGVRIEDMVEVTADGPRVIPRTPKELIVLSPISSRPERNGG